MPPRLNKQRTFVQRAAEQERTPRRHSVSIGGLPKGGLGITGATAVASARAGRTTVTPREFMDKMKAWLNAGGFAGRFSAFANEYRSVLERPGEEFSLEHTPLFTKFQEMLEASLLDFLVANDLTPQDYTTTMTKLSNGRPEERLFVAAFASMTEFDYFASAMRGLLCSGDQLAETINDLGGLGSTIRSTTS